MRIAAARHDRYHARAMKLNAKTVEESDASGLDELSSARCRAWRTQSGLGHRQLSFTASDNIKPPPS